MSFPQMNDRLGELAAQIAAARAALDAAVEHLAELRIERRDGRCVTETDTSTTAFEGTVTP